jgi:hypothetical protein
MPKESEVTMRRSMAELSDDELTAIIRDTEAALRSLNGITGAARACNNGKGPAHGECGAQFCEDVLRFPSGSRFQPPGLKSPPADLYHIRFRDLRLWPKGHIKDKN